MNHRYLISLLMSLVIAADVRLASGHVGDRVFPIPFLSKETLALLDQDDASVVDWVEAVGEPTLTPLDFNLRSHPSLISYDQYDPSNLDFRLWMGWSDGGKIHVAGQFADDIYSNEYDPLIFPNYFFTSHDSMTLLVDGDHTGGDFYFFDDPDELEGALKTNRQAQYYEAISRVSDGPMVSLESITVHALGIFDEPIDWMVHPPFARGGGGVLGENPTVWIVEFYVTCFDLLNHLSPEDSVVSQFTEGRIIGFDLGVWDFDEGPRGNHALFFLRNPEEIPKDAVGADILVDGLLLGPDDDFGGTAVQSNSWARIKASLSR